MTSLTMVRREFHPVIRMIRSCLFPFLKIGVLFAHFQASGNICPDSDLLKMWVSAGAIDLAVRLRGGRRSPAVACWASDHWVASSNPLRGKFRN